MYRNFYSYNDMPQPIRPESNKGSEKKSSPCPVPPKNNEGGLGLLENGKLFGKFELDDVILIVVALILFADDCDDTLLLLAIAFIFLSGIF